MLFILRHADHSIARQHELRCWYFDNGLISSEIVDPALIDSVAQAVTVNRKVPLIGQDGQDFPEFALDAKNEPVTVQQVIPLTVPPLKWMLTMTGAWNPNHITLAAASR